MSLDLPPLPAILIAAAGLCAAPAAARDPHECRTVLARFDEHRMAYEKSMAVAVPVLDRLAAAFDEVEGPNSSHADRHAVLYRHFVARYPLLRLHLSEITISSSDAMAAAATAMFCLKRETER